MSSRTLILGLMLALVGCSGTEEDATDDARVADASTTASLEFVSANTSLLPNDVRDLEVLYRNADGNPQAGVLIDFSLVGAATGASLSPTKANTDENGVAKTTLRAGSTASDLQVRARAGESVYRVLPLTVSSAFGTPLSVGVQYSGAREIASYTVTSLVMMTCAQALGSGLAGESTFHFSAPDAQASFYLGYGVKTALVGWGKDETGSKLVRGCTEFTAMVNENATTAKTPVTVQLQDIDLSLGSSLAVEVEVNASAAVRRFNEASTRGVAGVIAPSYSMFADADYLLDAVQGALTTQGNAAAATTLAARRTTESLAASLQPALTAQKAGPTAYGDATGAELARRGASLLLRWTIGATTLSSLSAQSADGSQTLAFPSVPQASVVARFAPSTAELTIDQLRVELGLGSYGKTLLGSLDAESRASGCATVFASWWSKNLLTELLAAKDAQAACVASLAKLDAAIEAELLKLDTSTSFQLTGAIPAHARNDQGVVDDLGPGEISGTWGVDALQAALQSPQRTAFQ